MLDWFAQIDWFAVICWLSAVSLIIAGLAGTVIPAIPGLPLIAAGGALIGWAGGFELIGWGTIATLAVLAIIGVIVDTVAQTDYWNFPFGRMAIRCLASVIILKRMIYMR